MPKTTVTVNEDTKTMAEAIAKKLAYSKESKAIESTDKDDDLYDTLRPDDLSKEIISKVHTYDTTFVAAATNAVGMLAIDAMKEDAKLDKVGGQLKMHGKNYVRIETARAFTPPPRDGQAQPDVAGVTSVKLHVEAANKGAGQLKRAADDIKSAAAAALGKV